MQIGRGIVELFEAIPDRIEVWGSGPTWRVTGGSFDSAVSYAIEAFDDPVVLSRQDRSRWWPRVTLTVTTDPGLAADAPPIDLLNHPEPEAEEQPEPLGHRADPGCYESALEEIFDHQEQLRLARRGIPEQRRRMSGDPHLFRDIG